MADDEKSKKETNRKESNRGSKTSNKETTRASSSSKTKGSTDAEKVTTTVVAAQKNVHVRDLDTDSFSKGVDPRSPQGNNLDVRDRIRQPITWLRLASGVRVIDVCEDLYQEVLVLLESTFLREETLCRSLRLWEDTESVSSLLDAAAFWLRDGCSVAAVDEGSGALLGVLLLRVASALEHTRTFSRIRPTTCGQLVHGTGYQKIVIFRSQCHKAAEVFEKYNVTSYLRIYGICVRPAHRGKGIGMALMQSAMLVGAALGQQVVMGIITTAQVQAMCVKLGMTPVYEENYAQYMQDGEVVFDNTGPGNYSAIVMAKRLQRVAQLQAL